MNYRQTLDFLYNQLPMFQRIGAAAYKHDLSVTIELSNLLGNPEHAFPSVHIAGTNGKGSVSHFIASILMESGLKTGLFTSPHMKDFRERARVNGAMMPKRFVVDFVAENQKRMSHLRPSFFEYTFAMAMDYFRQQRVEIAVTETGMGGRLDSTNVVRPLVSVITNIGFDHMQFLGDTLEKIAVEKAGIIKPGIPVVVGESQEEVSGVFTRTAFQNNSPLAFADKEWIIQKIESKGSLRGRKVYHISETTKGRLWKIASPLTGNYQRFNLLTVLQSIVELRKSGIQISDEAILKGVSNVIRNTRIKGRWQILRRSPLTICDTGHNPDGIREVISQLKDVRFEKLHFVLGMVSDKDVKSILSLLPHEATYYFCKPNIPRGLDPHILMEEGKKFGVNGTIHPSVKDAINCAQGNANPNDLVFIGGSTFVVAEAI
jgi:dihydrofolate synthase / folylpolyglutamate synthase